MDALNLDCFEMDNSFDKSDENDDDEQGFYNKEFVN